VDSRDRRAEDCSARPRCDVPGLRVFLRESPEEYPEEEGGWESDEDEDLEEAEEPAEREPFTLAAINRKLAELTRS
jgi:hypothetical protein